MSRIKGIITFQTKKSNLERDLRNETDIKWVTKRNRKIPHTLFESISLSKKKNKKTKKTITKNGTNNLLQHITNPAVMGF